MEIVSATATRRDVFAMKPAGLAAVANSDIAAEDTFMWLPELTSSEVRADERPHRREERARTAAHEGIARGQEVTGMS